MPTNDYSKNIVYLSKEQYQELITNETLTVNGQTITYNDNDIYVTPQAEPVTDVRVAGTSITNDGIANIPYGAGLNTAEAYGLRILNDSGSIRIVNPGDDEFKVGIRMGKPIAPGQQHLATFYGLAKAAGHDEASSTEPLGTYTPEAKGAIQKMLGVSDLIATEENNLIASKAYAVGDIFTANGKLYKATAAIAVDVAIIPAVEGEEIMGANCEETSVGEGFPHDVQVNGVSIVSNGIANVPRASVTQDGVVRIAGYGLKWGSSGLSNYVVIDKASDDSIKQSSTTNYGLYYPIVPANQHQAAFYGLAKAAGADEKNSTLPVGQYTDTAKAAIRSMIGAAATNDISQNVTDLTNDAHFTSASFVGTGLVLSTASTYVEGVSF